MAGIDENDPRYQEAKKRAIAFYDNEHNLTPTQRKDLYIFYEELFRRTLLVCSFGFATGVTLPFVLRKKGTLLNPLIPMAAGFVGLTVTPAIASTPLYNKGLKSLHQKYGEGSAVDKVIQVTPEPFAKSWFWSSYFKRSSEDPNMRIRDPRDPNAHSLSYVGRPKNGVPGFGNDNSTPIDNTSPNTPSNPELASAWGKIRKGDDVQSQQSNSDQSWSQINLGDDSNASSNSYSSSYPYPIVTDSNNDKEQPKSQPDDSYAHNPSYAKSDEPAKSYLDNSNDSYSDIDSHNPTDSAWEKIRSQSSDRS